MDLGGANGSGFGPDDICIGNFIVPGLLILIYGDPEVSQSKSQKRKERGKKSEDDLFDSGFSSVDGYYLHAQQVVSSGCTKGEL